MTTHLGRQRPPALEGELRFDEDALAAAARDFGHIIEQEPAGVLLPGSARDVAETVRWAASLGRRFAARGQGHSTFGRAQARGGIVAEMSCLRGVHAVTEDRVVAGAGATWSEVLAATLPLGRTPPVLPDHLELSVGGTLAVGGLGGTSVHLGAVTDHVIALDVVTGDGTVVSCSATQHRDLFDAVRAGLGQVAVTVRATLRVAGAPRNVRRFQLFYETASALVRDARLLAGTTRFDALQGAGIPLPGEGFAFRLDAAHYFDDAAAPDESLLRGLSDDADRRTTADMPYPDHLRRLAPLESALRDNGQWFQPHPWLAVLLDDAGVEEVVAGELERLDAPTDLGPFGQVLLSPIDAAGMATPLLRTPTDALCWASTFIRIPPTDDLEAARRLVDANRAIHRRVRRTGGVLYPVSACPMSPQAWREHFGAAFPRFAAAKRRYDPSNTLTPGYDVFPAFTGRGPPRAREPGDVRTRPADDDATLRP